MLRAPVAMKLVILFIINKETTGCMVNANTRRFFVSDNPAIFIRLFLLTNQRQGEVESASFSFLGTQPYTSSHFLY